MSEENKEKARRSWEIVNQRDPDLIERIYPADLVWHEPDQDIRGYEQAKQFVSTFFKALPDINITVEDVIAEGDKAVTLHRFEDGKIVEEWEAYDNLSVLQQLGLVPEQ
jgi:predicted ester cyclase